jgi:hypothetical protein
VTAGHSVEPDRWLVMVGELLDRGRPVRPGWRPGAGSPRCCVGCSPNSPRKYCWTIPEHAADASPDGMQHLLNRAVWDTDSVDADLRDYVVEHLAESNAVLVADETGDVKKGVCTVGVQRQYTGTAGRIETPRSRSISPTPAGPGTASCPSDGNLSKCLRRPASQRRAECLVQARGFAAVQRAVQ